MAVLLSLSSVRIILLLCVAYFLATRSHRFGRGSNRRYIVHPLFPSARFWVDSPLCSHTDQKSVPSSRRPPN